MHNPTIFKYTPESSFSREQNAERILTSLRNFLLRSDNYNVSIELPAEDILDPIEFSDLMHNANKIHDKIMKTPELKELLDD